MRLTLAASVLSALVASTAFGQANTPTALPGAPAVAAPTGTVYALAASAYVKIGEPLVVRFVEGKSDDAKKTYDTLGLKATKVPGFFSAVAAGDVVDPKGAPLFDLYNFESKKPLAPKEGAKIDASKGEVDLSAVYPEIAAGGTFVLVWKNATPLVINTLYSPGRSPREIKGHEKELEGMPEARRQQIMANFTPVVTHITALEYAVITTEKGAIKATFAYDVAPHTIDNWVSLAKAGFYDNTAFHRIIKGFMVQAGDPLGFTDRAGSGGPGYNVNAEFSDKSHERGVLSMARSNEPDSAGSQFFIMHAKKDYLNGKYTAFGQVLEGMDVVDKLAETPVSDDNGTVKGPKPKLESIRILPASAEMYGLKK